MDMRKQLRNLRKVIGINIRFYRHDRKMLLQDLACRAGIRLDRLDRYEMGKDSLNLEELARLANALDTELTRFFTKQREIN